MIDYNNTEFVAKTLYGLEDCLAKELKELGAENITPINRAVKFTGNKELLYNANLWLRTALTILVPIKTFNIRNQEDLYNKIKLINWTSFFTVNNTFAINTTVKSKLFTHTQFPALKAKDAIVDQFREKFGKRPSIDVSNPEIRINLHISDYQCSISLDSSGKTLNKRGYRVAETRAPINEVLAAGILSLMEWDQKHTLVDPMCGSGTFSIEAALMATNKAPGLISPYFAFQNWKDYDSELLNQLIRKAKLQVEDTKAIIISNDIDRFVCRNTPKNFLKADVNRIIKFSNEDFLKMNFKPGSVIILNPPYDVRLRNSDINDFYKKIGDALKNNCQGCTAWIISSNEEALKFIGLKPSKKYNLFNGKLPAKLLKYELYSGSKKQKEGFDRNR